MDPVEARVVCVLEGLDETLNAVAGPLKTISEAGNPKYTLSQRWAYERAAGPAVMGVFSWRKACIICKLLTWLFKPFYWHVADYDHCSDAIANFPTNLEDQG